MQAIFFYLSLPFLYGISILPYWVIYRISDLLFVLLYYVVGYRRGVVGTNLRNAFPEKSEKERKKIQKGFYKHLCDVLFETLKTLTISPQSIKKRLTFPGEELYGEYAQRNQNILVVMGHWGNWELTAPRFAVSPYYNLFFIYHELQNPYFDRLVKKMRTRLGNGAFTMQEAVRAIIRHKDILSATVFVADQTPSPKRAYWMDFLNQDTPVFMGPGRVSKKMNYPVLYASVKRLKRGYYELRMEEVVLDPTQVDSEEIVERFIRLLERDIREIPETWLWSHRRWKHKR